MEAGNEARLHSFHVGRAVREMTRALAIRENQVRAIIRAAKREGARIEVKIGDAVVTVFPDNRPQGERPIDGKKRIRL